MLVKYKASHTPFVLDPQLSNLQDLYGHSFYYSTDGYIPDNALLAKRAKSLEKLKAEPSKSAGQKPVGRAKEKVEGTKRSASVLSEKSSTSSSTERRKRHEECQKPPPPRAGGANLVNLVKTVSDYRKSSQGGVCYSNCVRNTDPPTLNSVTVRTAAPDPSICTTLRGPKKRLWFTAKFWKTRHVARKSI